jgi:hypothetical protein
MDVHVTGIGTIVLGIGAVTAGAWAYSDGRKVNYGPIAMLAVVAVGVGLVFFGAGTMVKTHWVSLVMTWAGMVVAAAGAVVFAINPKSFDRL